MKFVIPSFPDITANRVNGYLLVSQLVLITLQLEGTFPMKEI